MGRTFNFTALHSTHNGESQTDINVNGNAREQRKKKSMAIVGLQID